MDADADADNDHIATSVVIRACTCACVVHLAIPPSAKGLRPAPESLFWSRFRRVSEVRHREAPESEVITFSLASSSSRPCEGKKRGSVMCKRMMRDRDVGCTFARGVGHPRVEGNSCGRMIRLKRGGTGVLFKGMQKQERNVSKGVELEFCSRGCKSRGGMGRNVSRHDNRAHLHVSPRQASDLIRIE